MSPRTPRLSSDQMISLLKREGFAHVSTRGDHAKYRNDSGIIVIVPLVQPRISS